MRNTEEVPFDEAQAEIHRLESELISQYPNCTSLLLLRREMAQHLFRLARQKVRNLDVCRHYFSLRDALGYEHVSHKCTNAVILARIASHFGAKEEAIQITEAVLEEMLSATPCGEPFERMIVRTQDFLEQLRKNNLRPLY